MATVKVKLVGVVYDRSAKAWRIAKTQEADSVQVYLGTFTGSKRIVFTLVKPEGQVPILETACGTKVQLVEYGKKFIPKPGIQTQAKNIEIKMKKIVGELTYEIPA